MRRIYLDNSATTQVDPAVLQEMLPFFAENYGNPSSVHQFGQKARAAIDKARHRVAALMNAKPNEIIFTSGGTEANNLGIRGVAQQNSKHGKHIITTNIEHSAVKNVCQDLAVNGFETTVIPVKQNGIVDFDDIKDAVREDTILISVMYANNEIGTIQPIFDIGRLVREKRKNGAKIWFHTDAVQAAGKIPIDVEEIGCDLLSISAHKIYAPKGVGALYVRNGVRVSPQNIGGTQEQNRRGGTESVPLIVALGKASEIAAESVSTALRIKTMRDKFESAVLEQIPDCLVNGDTEIRVPNVTNIAFKGIQGDGLLINLDMNGIAVSTGSACSSGSIDASPIIKALGVEDDYAFGSIRFSFGRFNTDDDLARTIEILPRSVESLRSLTK